MTPTDAAEMVWANRQAVYNACSNYGIYGDDAEDVLSWVVARAMKKSESIRPGNNKGWVYIVACRRCWDAKREAASLPETLDFDDSCFKRVTYAHPSAEREAMARIEVSVTIGSASPLTEKKRRSLALDAIGVDYRDIARLEGIPVGTVKSRIACARAYLRAREEGAA